MNATTRQLFDQALMLSDAEREALIGALLQTVEEVEDEEAIQASWDEEIRQRVERVESGESKGIAWEEAEPWVFGDKDAPPPPET